MKRNNLSAMYDLIMLNGGASYQIETGEINPSDGYMVSLQGYESIVDVPIGMNEWQSAVLSYLLKRVKRIDESSDITLVGLLVENIDLYLGAWLKDNKLFFDISQKVPDYETAIKLGNERNQIAIFDNVLQESFYL